MLPRTTYRDLVRAAKRPEEVPNVHDHIWEAVNEHLGTSARSLPELVEQLGVMRFGHRPRVADTFAGSGQIPFEAARLGCDTYAADLSPVGCMLTWSAFHIVGASVEKRVHLQASVDTLTSASRPKSTNSGSKPMEMDGASRHFSTAWRLGAHRRAGWFLCCPPGSQQRLSA